MHYVEIQASSKQSTTVSSPAVQQSSSQLVQRCPKYYALHPPGRPGRSGLKRLKPPNCSSLSHTCCDPLSLSSTAPFFPCAFFFLCGFCHGDSRLFLLSLIGFLFFVWFPSPGAGSQSSKTSVLARKTTPPFPLP